ncbi:histidinol-phosphatase HisJ family protein [Deinococcus maricopensis]|uniref:Histidinol-phosphatase n=1 Tax=Deinococcus maricopensis (strain DSM 21211 / LMG 22137 / NRRL B-23946 / LB-34) TaxID=709986 RepID=E8U707_DEIML|nr:histidinol-phosphatase HisJ family protein [Deinococcus maricopensis]ADV66846.1 histidinol phosphate phosphatase HisJ family [Deinococcus maricopensis DSM 21211]
MGTDSLRAGLFDSHLHTPLCGHASGSPRAYVQAALEAGLAGVVFTDHMPMPAWYDAPWRMRRDQLDEYVALVLEARAAFAGRVEVRLGLEADFHPGTERYVAEVLAAHPWDYVIGSVHYLGAWGFDNPEFQSEYAARDLGELYGQYYALVEGAARSGLFDSIGHLDLPKKFGHRDPGGTAALRALDVVAERGLSLDFNTAGWRKPVAEAYPAVNLVQAAAARGVPFVLGSDAHAPGEVGHRFAEALEILGGAGARVVTYRGRERQDG